MPQNIIMEQTIYFYAETDAYFELSNFYLRDVTIDSTVWPSTEHFYQAQKFICAAAREQIRASGSAAEAFYLGRNLAVARVDSWETKKLAVMRYSLQQKFKQHADLKQLLLVSGNAVLKEKSPVDSFWGIGKDGHGKNMLGILLMELRTELDGRQSACDALPEIYAK
jgi:ribA/ribD-fused uncharacterized protein